MNKRFFNPLLVTATLLRGILSLLKIKHEARAARKLQPITMGTTDKLEILPLYEAVSENELSSGFGVSYLIRASGKTLLFDLGNNPKALSPSPLSRNMGKLKISMEQIDALVISHRHPDHVGGMKWWHKKTFSPDGNSQPPLGTLPVYVPEKIEYPGTSTELTKEPRVLAEGIATTGCFTFFEPYPLAKISPDDNEQALAVNVRDEGIVLIVGCGHMGVGTLLEKAKSIFNKPVIGVVGGLHYGRKKAGQLQKEIETLKAVNPRLLAVSPHDSYPDALGVFEKEFAEVFRPIRVGEPIVFP